MMIKYIINGFNIILLTAVVYATVNLFYTVSGGVLEAGIPVAISRPEETMVVTAAASRRLADYSEITRRNIFNAEKKIVVKEEPAVDLESLKRTDLDLRLLGTISGLGNSSYAVIEQIRKRQQNLYQVGDSVEGAVIKLIVRKKVVLTINGNDEVLEIPDENLSAGRSREIAPRGVVRQQRPPRGDSSAQQVVLDRGTVQEAFNNVNDLMRSVRVRPHFSDGKPDGIRLDSIAPESIFNQMGLKSQDIIVGVNGKRINTVDDCMEVYQNLSSASRVMLQVRQGEETRMIEYTIR